MSYITTSYIESIVEKILAEADIDNPPVKVDSIAEFICGLEFEWRNLDECAKDFADIVRKPEDFVDDVLRFPAVVTPDNSLYRDAPLIVQMLNVYRNRAIGHCLQKNGAYVITNVRWGDERNYSTEFFLENGEKVCLPEKFAFLGAPKKSIVSIGTYGCVQSKEIDTPHA